MRLITGMLAIGLMHAQTFDVASVKLTDESIISVIPKPSTGRLTWQTDLGRVISYAYRLPNFRVSGEIPGSESVYQINAAMPPDTTDDQMRLMLQSMLKDRFHMQFHWASKDVDGYILTAPKGGPKSENPPAGALDGQVVWRMETRYVHKIAGQRAPISELVATLERGLRTFVRDETGLKGNYNFAFHFATQDSPADVDAPSLFTAVQDIGLKLERRKGPMSSLVVDKIDRIPTDN